MTQQTRAADVNGLLEQSQTSVFLRERGEGDGRRVPSDPALKLLETREGRRLKIQLRRHGATVTVLVMLELLPWLSVPRFLYPFHVNLYRWRFSTA